MATFNMIVYILQHDCQYHYV